MLWLLIHVSAWVVTDQSVCQSKRFAASGFDTVSQLVEHLLAQYGTNYLRPCQDKRDLI